MSDIHRRENHRLPSNERAGYLILSAAFSLASQHPTQLGNQKVQTLIIT
jgi:hypothetical protein